MAKFAIGILFALLMGATAHGQATIVIGQSPAARCYQNAIWGRAHSSALRPCDSALEVDQLTHRERQRTWVNRAVINLHLGEPETALEDLQRAVDLGFDSAEIDMNRSAAYIRLARYQDAIDAATRALDAGLRDVEKAYYNRAVAYERLGRISEAYDDFSAAAAAAPHWQQPVRQLERFRVSSGT
jgi:tetratricopeptide (TPR) repeat protein